jgi:hypothetical protein
MDGSAKDWGLTRSTAKTRENKRLDTIYANASLDMEVTYKRGTSDHQILQVNATWKNFKTKTRRQNINNGPDNFNNNNSSNSNNNSNINKPNSFNDNHQQGTHLDYPGPPAAFNRAKILADLKNGNLAIGGTAFPYIPLC